MKKLLFGGILGWCAISSASAQTVTFPYDFQRATMALPVVSQGTNTAGNDFTYVYDRLYTKQAINLIRGRALNDKVPKNEILVVARPSSGFPPPAPIYLMVIDSTKIDKAQKPAVGLDGLVLGTGGSMSDATFIMGKGGGKFAVGIGKVETQVTGDANNGLMVNSLQASARVSGNNLTAKGVVGQFKFVKGGETVNGILAGGSFRASGPILCTKQLEVELPPL